MPAARAESIDVNSDDIKLVNLAFRVPRVEAAGAYADAVPGWSKTALHDIDGVPFIEARLGDVRINFFENAVYDEAPEGARPGFLHASFAVADLEGFLSDVHWRAHLTWGPAEIHGGFGRRRIAFFEPFPGCRIELMEEIDD